jgi:hypothetical protein
MSNLSFMYLSGNQLTGRLPNELRKLRKLGASWHDALRNIWIPTHAASLRQRHAVGECARDSLRADSLCVHGNDFKPKPTVGFVHGCCEDACAMALEVYSAEAGYTSESISHPPLDQPLASPDRSAWPYASTAVATAVMLAAVVSFWKFASGSLLPRTRYSQLPRQRARGE